MLWVQLEPSTKIPANKKETDSARTKVVQSNAGREMTKAAPDAFLGEKTRVVDRQTVSAKKMTETGEKAKPAVAKTQPKDQTQKPKAQAELAKKESPAEKTKPLSKLGLAILPEARRKGATQEVAQDQPQWANIGSQPQDYVDGIKQSDRTALNTKEYLYFGYHQRIRTRLEHEWTHLLKETLTKFYRSGRQLASETEYTTKLMVVLNDRGEITHVKILNMTGTQELEDVAVRAFNQAGPFPNPPSGLVKNGEIEVPWELKLRS